MSSIPWLMPASAFLCAPERGHASQPQGAWTGSTWRRCCGRLSLAFCPRSLRFIMYIAGSHHVGPCHRPGTASVCETGPGRLDGNTGLAGKLLCNFSSGTPVKCISPLTLDCVPVLALACGFAGQARRQQQHHIEIRGPTLPPALRSGQDETSTGWSQRHRAVATAVVAYTRRHVMRREGVLCSPSGDRLASYLLSYWTEPIR